MNSAALLSSAYFGPVQWFWQMHRHDTVLIEHCDSFVKQTYRNRCVIATAAGAQTLVVPVERAADGIGAGISTRISDHGNWRHLHRNALVSAYGDSPFFEYYADDILPFFERRWTFLYDFNMDITMKMCELLDIHPDIKPTTRYVKAPAAVDDCRETIHPKHAATATDFIPKEYYQVYSRRNGFIPDLSILDLLFNMGNESILYL